MEPEKKRPEWGCLLTVVLLALGGLGYAIHGKTSGIGDVARYKGGYTNKLEQNEDVPVLERIGFGLAGISFAVWAYNIYKNQNRRGKVQAPDWQVPDWLQFEQKALRRGKVQVPDWLHSFEQKALSGDAGAQAIVGRHNAGSAKGYAWLSLAAAQGNKPAAQSLSGILPMMSKKQIEEGRQLIQILDQEIKQNQLAAAQKVEQGKGAVP